MALKTNVIRNNTYYFKVQNRDGRVEETAVIAESEEAARLRLASDVNFFQCPILSCECREGVLL